MPIDRNTWKSLDTSTEKGNLIFKQQLVQSLLESFSGPNLAQQLSGQQRGVSGIALTNYSQNFPSGTTATANAANAYAVHISFESTGANPSITINNLIVGSPVTIKWTNTSGGSATLKMSATNPSGVAYTINAKGATYVNMVSTGASVVAGGTLVFNGNSTLVGATPDLELVYN